MEDGGSNEKTSWKTSHEEKASEEEKGIWPFGAACRINFISHKLVERNSGVAS
ncbi:hypothetical protein D3C79_1068190 [compost metagenome]